ncbi:hypothetical protein HMPREF9318_00587 [Streptococcus urinalis FB127-CNA-2]|uniref:hypothetical protein n=1 Tax=Streptococcus urinalis TaxID=149016 RepID=UPI000225CDB6|nr:hypothetical protein [Streptococcus urinalis]EKS22389.1 hypothetical protein HMPREF9318_00587 [Streptococcus urinalis FB127-CNA-2]VEF32202.1 Uncharacterised protein [Streptococcus urinalis]
MIIFAMGIMVYSHFLPLFNGHSMILKVILFLILVFIAFSISSYLTKAFEKWFNLEKIAEEAERPIFRIHSN